MQDNTIGTGQPLGGGAWMYDNATQRWMPGFETTDPPKRRRPGWVYAFVTIMLVVIGVVAGFFGAQSRNGDVNAQKHKVALANGQIANLNSEITLVRQQLTTSEANAQSAEDKVTSCQGVEPAAEKLIGLASQALTVSSNSVGATDVATLSSTLAQIDALTPQIQSARSDLNNAEVACAA